MEHETLMLLSNPQALRVEFCLDNQQLKLWWSPKAGKSFDCKDRFFSSRDDHLDVFQEIKLSPHFNKSNFVRSEYDAYHSVIHFTSGTLHLAVHDQYPVCFVWSDTDIYADFKTHRYDEVLANSPNEFSIQHNTPAYTFEFTAQLSKGSGSYRHGDVRGTWRSSYSRAELSPDQRLVIGAGLLEDSIRNSVADISNTAWQELSNGINNRLKESEERGVIESERFPELIKLRSNVVRGLHSMIDESGAYRASIKAIYYLLWVRDGGFSFPFQTYAGWNHKLKEFCQLLLANPTITQREDGSDVRIYGQLIHQQYGKQEEDGIYYVIWTLFTYWTQTGTNNFINDEVYEQLQEALQWVEGHIFDEEKGIFGEYSADETPAVGSRDEHWDYAIGKPIQSRGPQYKNQKVARFYDIYINILIHSSYTMMAAMFPQCSEQFTKKAQRLWHNISHFFNEKELTSGLPSYGDIVTTEGNVLRAEPWGPEYGTSVYVWGLTMPNYCEAHNIDDIRIKLFEEINAKPTLHFINGICSSILSIDPWLYDEEKLINMLLKIKDQANSCGKYMIMPGAMPEKFNAPEGNLYHDIRPQGFAMGAWLCAWSSLGVRRLPYGIALRPTLAYETLKNYEWRNSKLNFTFGANGKSIALNINGEIVYGTLQIPQSMIDNCESVDISLIESENSLLWLRSSVELLSIENTSYRFKAYGLSEITFSGVVTNSRLINQSGEIIECNWSKNNDLSVCQFTHFGTLKLEMTV